MIQSLPRGGRGRIAKGHPEGKDDLTVEVREGVKGEERGEVTLSGVTEMEDGTGTGGVPEGAPRTAGIGDSMR